MSSNKEDLKNKIIYLASYRVSKEMDILIIEFVRSIIDKLDEYNLKILNDFVNLEDEKLISYKKKESQIIVDDKYMISIIEKFQKF